MNLPEREDGCAARVPEVSVGDPPQHRAVKQDVRLRQRAA